MFTRIYSTVIPVADQEAALEFWVGKLGFEKRLDVPMGPMRFLTVAPVGARTELVLGSSDMFGNGKGFVNGISFIVDDVDATYEELIAKGVEVISPPEDMLWGARATSFKDPDGNQHFMTTD